MRCMYNRRRTQQQGTNRSQKSESLSLSLSFTLFFLLFSCFWSKQFIFCTVYCQGSTLKWLQKELMKKRNAFVSILHSYLVALLRSFFHQHIYSVFCSYEMIFSLRCLAFLRLIVVFIFVDIFIYLWQLESWKYMRITWLYLSLSYLEPIYYFIRSVSAVLKRWTIHYAFSHQKSRIMSKSLCKYVNWMIWSILALIIIESFVRFIIFRYVAAFWDLRFVLSVFRCLHVSLTLLPSHASSPNQKH